MSDEEPIDRDKLGALKQELGEHFPRILGYFAEDGVKSIDAIEEAVRARDVAAMVRPAHTLKGESLQFGAVPLGLAAERVEKIARQAVEDQQFPFDMVKHVVPLRPLFEAAIAALGGRSEAATIEEPAAVAIVAEPAPAAPATGYVPRPVPLRRPAGGFGRKAG